jgi:ABC-2 type transport system ATP-binding protein
MNIYLSMNDYVLRTTGLSKKYGYTCALQDVNIEIRRGQIYGLIGQNGDGKTTLMRAVTRLISVSDGEIELFGKRGEHNLQAERSKIGQIIETPAFYPNMTATQNLEIQRIISGRPYRGTVKRCLEKVSLTDAGQKKVRDFSLRMKQRLSLAMALISKPELLILDEPINGLDPKGIVDTRKLLRHLAQDKGITIMLSSHSLDELSQVATHYGIIDNGRLIRQLSAAELTRESCHSIRLVIGGEIEKTVRLLKEGFDIVNLEAVSRNELRIYEKINQTMDITRFLVQHGIGVESISINKQRLEEYFVNLTGGVKS